MLFLLGKLIIVYSKLDQIQTFPFQNVQCTKGWRRNKQSRRMGFDNFHSSMAHYNLPKVERINAWTLVHTSRETQVDYSWRVVSQFVVNADGNEDGLWERDIYVQCKGQTWINDAGQLDQGLKVHSSVTGLGHLMLTNLKDWSPSLLVYGPTSMEETQLIPFGSMSGINMGHVQPYTPALPLNTFISTRAWNGSIPLSLIICTFYAVADWLLAYFRPSNTTWAKYWPLRVLIRVWPPFTTLLKSGKFCAIHWDSIHQFLANSTK